MKGSRRSSAPVVLVHGAWHGVWVWALVASFLAAAGRAAVALDVQGHGLEAVAPRGELARPFDPAAFASERSPHAGVTLESAAAQLVEQIGAIGRPVVLVGHSLFGHVVTAAVERAPQLVERLVYVCAVMPASGTDAARYAQSPENAGERIGALVVGDPGTIGAIRLDVRSPDPGYREDLRAALYADVPRAPSDGAIRQLSSDLPIAIPAGASELSAERFGAVPRSYLRCTNDFAIRPALQTRMIEDADAAFPGTPTRVVDIESSHSPFLSQPERVASAILEG
jgi:pimeloyl-ACP methyl ester carboxylesterase